MINTHRDDEVEMPGKREWSWRMTSVVVKPEVAGELKGEPDSDND